MESVRFFRNFQVWQKYIFKEEYVFADGTKNYFFKNLVSQIYHFLRAKAIFFPVKVSDNEVFLEKCLRILL